MKKLLKKNIAVILSVVLILGTMLPVFSGVVANAYTAENTVIKNNMDTACENLIAEWKKLDSEVNGLEKLTPYELADEAAALDLSAFEGTDGFISARQNLAALLVNSFDPSEIKDAWGNLYSVVSGDFLSPFGVTGEGVADAFYLKSNNPDVTVNAVSEDEKHLFGAKSVTFDYSVDTNRTNVSGGNSYTIFMSNDPEKIEDENLPNNFGVMKKLYNADDLQFSFIVNKINTAASGAKMGFRITGSVNGDYKVKPTTIFVDINESMVGKVNTIKFSDLANSISGFGNWQERYASTDYIARIELQLIDSDSANNSDINITLGSVVALDTLEVPTADETANWNVSDWAYAAKSVDTEGVYNAEAFENAIKNAEELKEISGVEMNSTVSEYNTLIEFTVPEENLIAGIKPTISYYDGVSDKKEERLSTEFKKLGDGDLNKTLSIEAGNFKKEGAFFELIYDLGKNAVIEKAAILSDYENALRNYKYKIYMAKNEGDLFTKESLAFTYTNRASSWLQVFDFTNGPDKLAKYIAIRIYVPACDMASFDGFVRFNEIGIYGTVQDYKVIASEFSSNAINALGRNILALNSSKAYVRADTGNRQKFSGLFDEQKYPITYLYDADVTTQIAIGGNYRMYYDGDTTSLHIYYDLGKTYAIEKFLYSSIAGTLVETGKYRIHASNDLNKLFNGKSVIVDYDNTVETSRMQIFTMSNKVNARYVSFEITLPIANYKAWVARNGVGSEGCGIHIGELGVYGGEYVKTNEKENLLNHVPVELNRVDESGVKTEIGQSEYGGDDNGLTVDGDYDTFTTVDTEGKKLEYTYNLYQNANIESIRFITLDDGVRAVKFYASSSKNGVYDESALVYEYNKKGETIEKAFSKYFVDAPLTASYVRMVIDSDSDSVDIAEIEVNGFNKTKPAYENIVLNHTDYLELYLVDSQNNKSLVHEDMDKWLPAWSPSSEYQEVANAFDGDLGTVYTYYGGQNNKTSVNMFLNLQAVSCVDNISIYTSVLDDYRPSKMNIYVGNSRDEVFAANATPVKSWTEKILSDDAKAPDLEDEKGEDIVDGGEDDDDFFVDFETGKAEGEQDITIAPREETPANMGLYATNFTPMEIGCIRIEIVEANPKYFAHINKVGGIITEVQVNGFSSAGNAATNVIESTKDFVMRGLDPVNAMDKSNNNLNNVITDGIEGEPVYTVNSVGENIAVGSCSPSAGYIEYMQTNDLANTVTLADIDDIYFSYKVKNVYRSGSIAARIYIYDGSKWAHDFATKNGTATVIYVDSSNTEWVHTSMSKQFGESWKEWLAEALSKSAEEITINRIRLGWNNIGGAADMQFTGMYYTFNEGDNPYYKAMTDTLGDTGQAVAFRLSKYYIGSTGITPTYINSGKSDEYANIDSVGGDIGNTSCSSGSGTIRFAVTNKAMDVTLAEIDDIYLSYKVNNAIMGENLAARIYIYDQNGDMAHTFANQGTVTVFYFPVMHKEWTQISIKDVAGNNWKAKLVDSFNTDTGTARTAEEIKISEIRFGFNHTGEADMAFGNMFYQYKDSNMSSMSHTNAISVLNKARSIIDTSTVAKKTVKEFKYNVQFLADYLDMEKSEAKYIAGDYNNTEIGMKELALIAQYLDKTLGADDFMDPYCADINGDGALSEEDLIKLRKQLLGIK